jgi:hypothetical protein
MTLIDLLADNSEYRNFQPETLQPDIVLHEADAGEAAIFTGRQTSGLDNPHSRELFYT